VQTARSVCYDWLPDIEVQKLSFHKTHISEEMLTAFPFDAYMQADGAFNYGCYYICSSITYKVLSFI
jgi:hypothetical protein